MLSPKKAATTSQINPFANILTREGPLSTFQLVRTASYDYMLVQIKVCPNTSRGLFLSSWWNSVKEKEDLSMNKMKAWIIFVLLLIVIGYNGLANYLPLNGKSTGELSDAVPMYITPPGYVFSIWGFIYLISIIWAIRLLLGRTEKPDLIDRTFKPFIAIATANILWLTFWHYQQVGLSVLVMLVYLISLIWMYVSIQSKSFRFWDRFPWSIHMGWISVATIVNISYWLNTKGFDGFGFSDATWTNALLFFATLLAIWIDKNFRDLSYTLVFSWAFAGIGFKAFGDEITIAFVAFGLAATLAIRALYMVYQRKN